MDCSEQEFSASVYVLARSTPLHGAARTPDLLTMSLKPKRITVNVPGELVPLIRERMKEEHIGSESKYFLSLLLFDMMTRCPHKITAQVVHEPEEIFYKVIDEIVREFPNVRSNISEWLRHRIEDIVKDGAK